MTFPLYGTPQVLTSLQRPGVLDPGGLAPRAHYNVGLLLDERGDVSAAVQAYATAVRAHFKKQQICGASD
jgi:hypothetical protein